LEDNWSGLAAFIASHSSYT